jgi:hypothetical protein
MMMMMMMMMIKQEKSISKSNVPIGRILIKYLREAYSAKRST